MRPLYLLLPALLLITCFFTHCRQPDKGAVRFTPAAIPSFVAEIDITRDTVLYTPGGTRLHIAAHALDAGGATHAKLVIQEALRMSDIVRAGLFTTANGQPLSSGGMINIEPAPGQTLSIIKPIGVSLPSPYLQKNMQLYKGVPDEQGNINWTTPQPLADTSRLAAIERGRQLFINSCASCHSVDRDGTGPALAHITALRDKKWLYSFTKNNQAVMAAGDPYAIYLFIKNGSTPMPVYPALPDQALDALYTYIDNESNRLGLPLPANDYKKCVDSCIARLRRQNKQPLRGAVISYSDGPVRQLTIGFNPGARGDTNLIAGTIPPSGQQALSYKFSIKTFGWYNIDILLDGTDGVKESRLIVQPKGRYTKAISLSLIIPSLKIFHEGNLLENSSDSYCFHSNDGNILLPQGVKAFILIMGEADGRPVFALQPFITATNLLLQPEPLIMSKEDIRAKLNTLDWTAPAGAKDVLPADTALLISPDTATGIGRRIKDSTRAKSGGCDCSEFRLGTPK